MAKRNEDTSFERKLLTKTQEEKRNAQRKRLMQEGLAKREKTMKRGNK